MSGGGGDGVSRSSAIPWPSVPGGVESGSGSGGEGGAPGPATTGAGREVCGALEFDARLRNVDARELTQLSEGDVLAVVYRESPSRMVAVIRRLPSGGVAPTPVGALLDRLQDLLPCLAILEFEAEVTKLDGGNTRVHVRPAMV